MGLGATPVVPRLLYRVSFNMYCPHAHIIVGEFSNIRFTFQANIRQLYCQSTFELIQKEVLRQKLLISQRRKQLSLSECRDQKIYIFL